MCKKLLAFILLILCVFVLYGCRDQEVSAPQDMELYINVESSLYRGDPNKLAGRNAAPNGNYIINFAVNGEQKLLEVSPAVLENGLDMQDIVGLVFDENGIVTDFKTVEDCTGGYVVKSYFVESTEGNTVVCNASPNYDGHQKTVTISDSTQICRIGGTDLLVGTYTSINADDEITAICDEDGNVTHVFVEPLRQIPDIYWNIERKYNSALKSTSRESNAVGIYEFRFAVNGEVVTLQTKDQQVASSVDAIAARCMALTFDEEGYINSVTTAYNACGGSFGSWFHVTNLIGNTIYAHKYAAGSDQGNSSSAVMANNFVAYDMSSEDTMGQPTQLRVGDQVHCLVNTRGQVIMAFVISRLVDTEVYWNVERHYDSSAKQTTRRPDSDGWYHILLAVNGEQVTLKTKDKTIVNSMDGRNDKHFALTTDGDVITAFYKPSAPSGGNYFASWSYVTEITDSGVVTAQKNADTAPEMAKMAENCEIYNVSTMYSSHVGEKTQLRVGDMIHGERNLDGELVLIYVVGGRLANSPMYWNFDRKWDSKNQTTTRTPDADGYYTLTLAVKGEQTAVRTKDINLVNTMEKSAAAAFGLSLNGDIVKRTYTAKEVAGGSGWSSWCDVIEIKDNGTVVTKRIVSGDNQGKTYSARMDWNCKVYDVSSYYSDHKGEKATLQVGDRIQGYLNKDGEIEYIYIVSRSLKANNPDHFHCVCVGNADHTCDDSTGFTAWANKRMLPTDGSWYLTTDVTLEEAVTIPAGCSLQLCLNGYTVNGQSTGTLSMFRVNGELIITDCQESQGSLISNTTAYGGVIYQFDSNDTNVELYAGHLKSSLASQTRTGGIIYIGDKGSGKATFSMYGGTITGIEIEGNRGGAIQITQGQSFNMYGGIIQNGKATGGGNIALTNGSLNLMGGTITGGISTNNQGGGIYVAGNGKLHITGNVQITGNTGGNLYLPAGKTFTTGDLADTALVGITATGAFTTITDQNDEDRFACDDSDALIVNKDSTLYILSGHTHCRCGSGTLNGVGGHSCDSTQVWAEWTDPNSLPAEGNYYLTTDVTISGAVNVAAGSSLQLCLHGHTVNGHSTGTLSMFRVNGSLTITDCKPEAQWGSIIANTMAYGDVIYQFDSSKTTVDLFAGHLKSSLASQQRNGGIVYMGDKGTVKATFNMYNGTITGLKVTSGRGGAVKITQGHTFNMYGGVISGGSAPNGGNMDLTSGALNLYGGTVKGGSASDKGGNIYVNSGTLTIDGGTVDGGSSTNYGGNIDFVKGTLNLKSGSVKNGSSKNAGGIRIQKDGIMNMYGGELAGSYATSESGNLQINTGATFNMYGGTIADGGRNNGVAVTAFGGNINIYGTMNMYGGSVTNGAATKGGGNIAGYGSFVLNMTDHTGSASYPSISAGTAPSGGNVILRGTAPKLNMSAGSITNGDVYITVGTVQLQNKVSIEKLHLDGGALTASSLDDTSHIGIAMTNPGVFLANATDAMLLLFESTDDRYQVALNGTELMLENKEE